MIIPELNRRDFLKILGIAGVATQVPIIPLRRYPDFNPRWMYGDYVIISDRHSTDKEFLTEAYDVLNDQIRKVIPPHYRRWIKWSIKKPGGTGDDPQFYYWTLGWYYGGGDEGVS